MLSETREVLAGGPVRLAQGPDLLPGMGALVRAWLAQNRLILKF